MAMPDPIGPFSCAEDVIVERLVDCDLFAKFCKFPASRNDLLARVYRDKVPSPSVDESGEEIILFPEMIAQRPFVCIWPAQPAGRFAWSPSENGLAVGIDYRLYFEANDEDAVNDADYSIDPTRGDEMFRWWMNLIGGLLVGHRPDYNDAIKGLIMQGNFALNRISGVDLWHKTRNESGMGTYFAATAVLETGTEEG